MRYRVIHPITLHAYRITMNGKNFNIKAVLVYRNKMKSSISVSFHVVAKEVS